MEVTLREEKGEITSLSLLNKWRGAYLANRMIIIVIMHKRPRE